MSSMMKLTDAEVAAVATEVLSREMKDLPFHEAEAHSGEDQSGVQSLFIAALVGPGVPPLDGKLSARLHGALHEALLNRGEERFPYFIVQREDDELSVDEDMIDPL